MNTTAASVRARIVTVCLGILALVTLCAPRASAVSYEEVLKRYQFDHSKPLNIEIRETKDFPALQKIYFSYDSPNGGRVPAVLFMPKAHVKPFKPERATVSGTFPTVFFMHFHVSDKSLADVVQVWTGYGLAILAIDGVYRGEREEKGQDILMPDPMVSAAHIGDQIRDILRGFDVIASWKGLDPGRIGYLGFSMGSITGTAACAIDERVRSVILADGAAEFPTIFDISDYGQVAQMKEFIQKNNLSRDAVKAAFDFVDPGTFAPHLESRPVLLMNGREDTTFPPEVVNKLYDAVSAKDKKIIWYNSGHILPFDKVVYDALKWFRATL